MVDPVFTSHFLTASLRSHLCIFGQIWPLLIQSFLPSFLASFLFLPFRGYFIHAKVFPKEALHRSKGQTLCRSSRKVWVWWSWDQSRRGHWEDSRWSVIELEGIHILCFGFHRGWVPSINKTGKPDTVLLISLTLIHLCLLKLWFDSLLNKYLLTIC